MPEALGVEAGVATSSATPCGTCSPPAAPDADIGLLSGGYGADELLAAGAFRVYQDAAELHRSLDELGFE